MVARCDLTLLKWIWPRGIKVLMALSTLQLAQYAQYVRRSLVWGEAASDLD
jgi:hypothetical protein